MRTLYGGGLSGNRERTVEGIRDVHRRFCEVLPERLCWIEVAATQHSIRLVPGELRKRDVKVGNHVPISPGALPRFLQKFEQTYGSVSALLEKGVLVSENPRAPLRLAFSAMLASRWLPGLFPDKTN